MRRFVYFPMLITALICLAPKECLAAAAVACGYQNGAVRCAAALRFPTNEEAQQHAIDFCWKSGIEACQSELGFSSECRSVVLLPTRVWSMGQNAISAANLARETCEHATYSQPGQCAIAFTVCEASNYLGDIGPSPALETPGQTIIAYSFPTVTPLPPPASSPPPPPPAAPVTHPIIVERSPLSPPSSFPNDFHVPTLWEIFNMDKIESGIAFGIGVVIVLLIFAKRTAIVNFIVHDRLPYKLPVYGEDIQCLFKRTQRVNWYGRVIFGIVANLSTTHAQLTDVRKYWLGRVIAFDSLRRQRQNELALMHLQLALSKTPETKDKNACSPRS